MKKLKFLGTAVLAASLLFAGCSSPEVDDPTGGKSNPAPAPAPVPDEAKYTVEFSDTDNEVSYADGVYTVSVANANDSEWGNQIFIKDPNAEAEVAAGDKIHATITLEADKEITTLFVKDQFNGVLYSGIDIQKNLPANTETVFDIYGTVTDDFDETAGFVLDLRGNAAETTLKMSNIKVEKLGDYAVSKVVVSAATESIAAGETTTLKAVDQYGFEIANATFEITSENATATLDGNVITGGNKAESITVIAKSGSIASEAITITVTVSKDYAKYWNADTTTEGGNAPADYFSIWTDHNWCGSSVTLSDMTAAETGVSLTQSVSGSCWFGTQIWYGLSQASNVSFKVTSTVAGAITVNDVVYVLEENTAKTISLENVSGKLAIQLGQHAEGETSLGSCTFTITDFSVSAAE